MIYANEVVERTTKEDRLLLCRISELLWEASRDISKVKSVERMIFECHSICRAICLEITDGSVKCVDGNYIGMTIDDDYHVKCFTHSHSWLTTRSGNIIDPYPPGMMSTNAILLVNDGWLKPYATGRYHPDDRVTREIANPKTWRKARVLQRLFH